MPDPTSALRPVSTFVQRFARHLWAWHLKPFLIGLDVFALGCYSLFFGGVPYWTISCRCGVAMGNPDSWVSRVPWPAWWRKHCMADSTFRLVPLVLPRE